MHIVNNTIQYELSGINISYSLDGKLNYFNVLGMNAEIDIDENILRANYFALQIMFHPDRNINTEQTKKEVIMKLSAIVNEAYKCLSNEVCRITHILKINGCDDSGKVDNEFMLEALEWHEKVLEGDQDIKDELKNKRKNLLGEIRELVKFEKYSDAGIVLGKIKTIDRLL